MVMSGVADIAFMGVLYKRNEWTLPNLCEIPFIGGEPEATSVAVWKTYKKFFEKANEFKGVKLLTFWVLQPHGVWQRIGDCPQLCIPIVQYGFGCFELRNIHERAKQGIRRVIVNGYYLCPGMDPACRTIGTQNAVVNFDWFFTGFRALQHPV